MKIYMLAEHDELDEIAEPMSEAIRDWLAKSDSRAELIHPDEDNLQVGVFIETGKKVALKDPVNFLYTLAKEYKAEFVVGLIAENDRRENVCFFGFEEGRPDINEIAQYLGLKR